MSQRKGHSPIGFMSRSFACFVLTVVMMLLLGSLTYPEEAASLVTRARGQNCTDHHPHADFAHPMISHEGRRPADSRTSERPTDTLQPLASNTQARSVHTSGLATHSPDRCEAKTRWKTAAQHSMQQAFGSSGKARWPRLPPGEKWPFTCGIAGRTVCFHNNEIVVRHGSPPRPADAQFELPQVGNLEWFQTLRVRFVLPGYHDSLEQALKTVTPMTVRPVARSQESQDLQGAPVLNITPIVFYPIYPFNLGDTLGPNFVHSWVYWLAQHPDLAVLPFAIVLPHGLNLPPVWRIIEHLGIQVETFSTLSHECRAGPLCFDRFVGCTPDTRRRWRDAIAHDDGVAWERFRAAVVAGQCGIKASEIPAPRQQLVIGFVQRQRGRQILNLEEILAACQKDGLSSRCIALRFQDILTDICLLQEVDILVGVHGADLANGLFMRPGTKVIEVKAHRWYKSSGKIEDPDANFGNAIAHKYWATNNSFYYWYGATEQDSFPDKRSAVPARDSDVRLSWPLLRCTINQIQGVTSRAQYASDTRYLEMYAGCRADNL